MPVDVPTGTVTVAVMFTGEDDVGFTTAPGVKPQVAPVTIGLKLQLKVTLWSNEPWAVT